MSGHPSSFTVFTWAATRQRRRKHHKVFSGCTNCKRRRVRCDEGKPSCARCVKGHIHCDYEPLKVWMFDPDAPSKPRPPDPSLPKPHSPYSEPYRRAIQLYHERAAPIFASHFGAPFWLQTVLQMSHSEPLVQDAILTASLLIEGLDYPSQQLHADFFRAYNKAIRNFTNPALSYSIETILTACSLFASFEFCMGSFGVALTHVRSGLQISKDRLNVLERERRSDTPEGLFLRDQFLPMMVGFGLQARMYGLNLLTDDELSDYSDGKYCLPRVPLVFISPQQAHYCLAGLIHHSAFFESSPGCGWDWQLLRVVGNLLTDWKTALDVYERRLSRSRQLSWRPTLCVLCCNHWLMSAFLKRLVVGSDVVRGHDDEFSAIFKEILEYLKESQVLAGLEARTIPKTELEVLPMLFIMAVGSVQATLRDEALRLLNSFDRKEANWTAQTSCSDSGSSHRTGAK